LSSYVAMNYFADIFIRKVFQFSLFDICLRQPLFSMISFFYYSTSFGSTVFYLRHWRRFCVNIALIKEVQINQDFRSITLFHISLSGLCPCNAEASIIPRGQDSARAERRAHPSKKVKKSKFTTDKHG